MTSRKLIVIALLTMVCLSAVNVIPLEIKYVSSDPDAITLPIYSSLRGGKLIYIKALGHSPDPTDNKVFLGIFPCLIPADGVTDTFITCETTDSYSAVDINTLPVTLISYGTFITTYSHTVSYKVSVTPILRDVFPTAGFGGSTIDLYGVHRIFDVGDGSRDLGDIRGLKFGDDFCSTFDLTQDASFSPNAYKYLKCIQSRTGEAGKYNVSEKVITGYADNHQYLRRPSLIQDEYFEFTTLPTVNSVSPATGNIGGQYLTIKGTGFSANAPNNSVSVDGNDCAITAVTNEEIKCTLAPRNPALSNSLLTSNSSNQQNGYFSGAGLSYGRYQAISTINTLTELKTAVRNGDTAALGTPKELGYRGDMRSGDVYSSNNVYPYNEAQYWRGFFTPPVDGTYTFRGSSDDDFALYMASNYGSVEHATTPLIYSYNFQSFYDYFKKDIATTEASIDLLGGKSYYIEAYHVNGGGSGYFDMAVQVPNNNTALPYQIYQVNNIVTDATVQPQIYTYSVSGTGLVGFFQMKIVRINSNLDVTYDVGVNVTYGATAATFQTALNKFDIFKNYQITVTREIYDANNLLINDTAGASRIDYVVSIYVLRPTNFVNENFAIINYNGFTGTFSGASVQSHSPLITGTFELSIGGVPVKDSGSTALSYGISQSKLQTAIRTSGIVDFDNVKVSRQGSCGYSCKWIVEFKGYNKALPNITVNGASLVGGSTTPTVAVTTRRNFSSSIDFDPIDYRFLNTDSSQINVRVMTNGIPSICTGTCGYAFNLYSQITALSYSGAVLSFGLSDPIPVAFTSSNITVSVDGKDCPVNAGANLGALTCNLATNTDASPILIAGDVTPIISITQYGIAALQVGVNPLSIPLIASHLSVTTGGNNGGYLISLHGSGFPLTKDKMTITICSNQATIKTINNIQVDFYVPSCPNMAAQAVTVTVGALSASNVTFTYVDGSVSAPIITQITPNSANHGIKGVLQISGSQFGADPALITVFLSNATGKIYQLSVLQMNGSYIKVGLPGGRQGIFTVEVNHQTNGDSIAGAVGVNIFTYAFTISSISPQVGSYYGNTLLTITGTNFATESQQTLAYVGWMLNWFCTIESITTTDIQCRTPKISSRYKTGQLLEVVISTRLLILNLCTGNCSFSYLNDTDSPNLTSISSSSASVAGTSTQTITLTGHNLIDSNNFAEVTLTHSATGLVSVISAVSSTSTSVSFDVTSAVISGKYDVRVRNMVGGTNPMVLSVSWAVGSVSWSSGGSTAGGIISLTNGGGYPAAIDGRIFALDITSGTTRYPVNIVSCCTSNSIEIEMPAAATGTSFTLTFTGPIGNPTTKTYTVSSSLTDTATLDTTSFTVGTNSISLTATGTPTITAIKLVSTLKTSHFVTIPANSWTTTASTTTFSADLFAGSYRLEVSTSNGFMNIASTVDVPFPSNVNPAAVQMSFNGGKYTITGSNLSPVSYIEVNGFKGQLITHTNSDATYQVPAFTTTLTQSTFNQASISHIDPLQFTYISDTTNSNSSSVFDSLTTTFYGSNNTDCWVGIDAGVGIQVSVSRFRFFPNFDWSNVAKKILGATFQGSNDLSTWTTLATVDQTIHTGWNVIKSTATTPFRYIRFHDGNISQCNIAQIQLYGIIESNVAVALASQQADLIYKDGFNTQTYTNMLQFRQDHSAIVTGVSPRYGDIFGGYTLTITGSGLSSGTPIIMIDGVVCASPTGNDTQINCTVGVRSSTYTTDNTFEVTIGSSAAILRDSFLYVLKWSNSTTWGVDIPPVDNDLIYVPKGTTLFVDQNTPILEGIAVEGGTLVFSNDVDLTVQAGFITLNGGKFIAGTEQHPHTRKLTFIMHGGYYGKQQPMFGNKGIGCKNCKFSMYGAPRSPTWTSISATVNAGDTQLTVIGSVDWQIGQEIVLASTSFDPSESQRRTISNIVGQVITVSSAFLFKHVSVLETHGTDFLEMRAEVGLLTRNIKMMGDSATSVSKMYGSHLMLAGESVNGFEGHVAYSEFMHCGQPQITGRYCIHFHMAGDVPTSYVRGNAVHDSFARITTIHGVHFLTVQDNVGHKVRGHNFFVEDGIETNNLIKNNLAMHSIAATNMLQTDTSVASFWITNPANDVIGNHAAGSDFYGIWYEIKKHPDGPSATNDVCPIGNPLGTVSGNVAHSNTRFGLRLFHLYARKYPCDPVRDDSLANDPWANNPSIMSTFSNFTLYKNVQNGILAQNMGNVVFDNFVIAQSYHNGIEYFNANFTKEPPQVLNSVIIGKSNTNVNVDQSNYTGMVGITTGKTGTFKISNVRFYNYPSSGVAIRTCKFCDDALEYTNLGTQLFVDRISFDATMVGKKLFMLGLKRCVIYDTDGCLSSSFDGVSRTSGSIVHGFNHIANFHQNTCPSATNPTDWDSSVYCDNTQTVRRVFFTNLATSSLFSSQNMKVTELLNINDTTDPNMTASIYTSISSRLPGTTMEPKDKQKTYALPFLTGKIYNIWWGAGIDFMHMSMVTTPLYVDADEGMVFKFNYTQNRQFFNVGTMRGGVKTLTQLDYIAQETTNLDIATCYNGQHYHDNQEGPARYMEICQSGKNRTLFQYTEVNGIICKFLCPLPPGEFVKEGFIRLWSNVSQWPGQVLPAAGDTVYVSGNWTVRLDIDPAVLGSLTIDGTLFADDTRDVNITADWIHVRAGNISAGSSGSPFLHNFVIQVNGHKTDNGYYIDPILAGNKLMVVSGTLNLHGVAPGTVNTYLKQSVAAGSSIIDVASKTGWAVGDTLVIAPSYSKTNQFQMATIQTINTDGTITLNSALQFNHYGSNSFTINNHYGKLDTRARVSHINRNVKIVPGPDVTWGYGVTIYGYKDTNNKTWIGNAELSGVQFQDGGQLDTLNAPLKFLNVKNGNYKSSIKDCSFVNCMSGCIRMDNAESITITNNIFYNVAVIGIEASKVLTVTVTNNVVMGVKGRSSLPEGSQLTACLSFVEFPDPLLGTKVLVRDNFCQGSSQHGFAFTFMRCNEQEINPFANNTVGSAKIGFILNTNGQQCQGFSYAKAYACGIGQICGSPGISRIQLTQFIMADNGRGVTLKFGAREGGTNHTAILTNSYVTAISRPTCTQCYASGANDCMSNFAVRILTASGNGEVMPSKFGTGFDTICKAPVFDSKNFLINNTFDAFAQNYTASALSSTCGNNFVFKPHPIGQDMVGSVYLYDTKCVGCDADSYLTAPSPNPAHIGWFGGCGDILCTGYENYIVQDFTGTFLGFKGTITPHSMISNNEAGCSSKNAIMNAHVCQGRQDFGVLQYESKAADFKTRIMWPVSLTADGYGYSTTTNAWREWEWLGNEPQNKRFGRFVSVINFNRTYNMTFVSEPPHKIHFQIQQRNPNGGDVNNWVQFRLHYPRPNSIRLLFNGQIVDPILLTDVNNTSSGLRDSFNKTVCGSHAYLYTNYTISFILTQQADCKVEVELTESIQLTTHFAMNITQFFNSGSHLTNFINNLCALLNIVDTSRVKVVGVHSGSTTVTAIITPTLTPNITTTTTTNGTTTTNTTTDPSISSLASTLSTTISTGTFGTSMTGAGMGTVLGATSVFQPITTDSTADEDSSKVGLIVGLVLAGITLAVVTVIVFVYCIRRRGKISDMMINDQEDINDKVSGQNPIMINEKAHEQESGDKIKMENLKREETWNFDQRFD